jgi:hypothetical protein
MCAKWHTCARQGGVLLLFLTLFIGTVVGLTGNFGIVDGNPVRREEDRQLVAKERNVLGSAVKNIVVFYPSIGNNALLAAVAPVYAYGTSYVVRRLRSNEPLVSGVNYSFPSTTIRSPDGYN